jgi:uncharacterized protein (DUF1501 family)
MTVVDEVDTCCPPGAFSRRTLLRGLGAAGVLTFGTAAAHGQAAFAAGATTTDTLVVIFLRGAADWLSIVPPVGDPAYAAARPNIGVPASRALHLDSTFGLHPALQPLMPFWNSRQLGFVHAAGSADPTRSHFEAQAAIESAAYGTANVYTGWLDRYLQTITDGTFTAVAHGDAAPPSLAGPASTLAMASLSSFSLPSWLPALPTALGTMYSGLTHSLGTQAVTTLGALGTAARVSSATYAPANGASYPGNGTGPALLDLARLIKANVGLQVATLDVGNWDMHEDLGHQGGVDGGWMHDNLTDLGNSLAAFATDLGTALSNVTVVTVTDFGRRVQENGSGGVDHGHGQAMMLLGGGTRGGQVWGSWPTLADNALDQGDLAGTTDLRSVFGELLADRMGASDAVVRSVFPGWTPTYLDAVAARS